jgi:hypothetical protein
MERRLAELEQALVKVERLLSEILALKKTAEERATRDARNVAGMMRASRSY